MNATSADRDATRDPAANMTPAEAQADQHRRVRAIIFLMRPIGGWLFGKLADRRGRR